MPPSKIYVCPTVAIIGRWVEYMRTHVESEVKMSKFWEKVKRIVGLLIITIIPSGQREVAPPLATDPGVSELPEKQMVGKLKPSYDIDPGAIVELFLKPQPIYPPEPSVLKPVDTKTTPKTYEISLTDLKLTPYEGFFKIGEFFKLTFDSAKPGKFTLIEHPSKPGKEGQDEVHGVAETPTYLTLAEYLSKLEKSGQNEVQRIGDKLILGIENQGIPMDGSVADYYKSLEAEMNVNANLHSLNYAKMHILGNEVLTDRIWELYDIYFDSSEIPEADFQAERERFVQQIFGWIIEFTIMGIAGGVVGNYAYEKLKQLIEGLHDTSSENIKRYYKRLKEDLTLLLNYLEKAELQGEPILTRDIADNTGMSRETVRAWLKKFGYIHMSNCTWKPTRR